MNSYLNSRQMLDIHNEIPKSRASEINDYNINIKTDAYDRNPSQPSFINYKPPTTRNPPPKVLSQQRSQRTFNKINASSSLITKSSLLDELN
jgi:hypothetical protein